jgi:hypothetical protein
MVYIWNKLLFLFMCYLFYITCVSALQVAANGGKNIPELQVWKAAHKKKELVGGKVAYYGNAPEKINKYTETFKKLHGEDSDPLSQPLDETAVMISGGGKPHGRTSILYAVHKPTITLPRIRHITSSSDVCMPPRPRCSTKTSDDVSFLSFLSSF